MKVKVILLLIVVSCMCAAQETPLHKKISVEFHGLPLADVLQDIGKKAGVRIAFAEKLVKPADFVKYKADKKEAGRILTRILLPRGLKLSSVKGNLVGIAEQEPYEEFRIKREQNFEFESKPVVTRKGDTAIIKFETKGFPDCTVALENGEGKIVRHLASGVLGPNAPEPFVWNSKKQVLVWDGKDDQERYVDDKDGITVRVSIGLKPRFEKNLFWEPKRRHGREAPLFQVQKEGVYVYDGGNGLDYVELYDHQGNYIRTVYPFPASKIDKVKGLNRYTYPQDKKSLPVKPTFLQQTFLTCGNYYGYEHNKKFRVDAIPSYGGTHYGMYGSASSIFAVNNKRIALGKVYLCRFAADGSSGGMSIEGPSISLITTGYGRYNRGKKVAVVPRSGALSPDGKTLYLTGYNFCHYGKASNDIVTSGKWDAFHCVMKMSIDSDKPPVLFAGSDKIGKAGTDNRSFKVPASVAADRKGRVYVADYMNDRIQVFSPQGAYLKTLKVVSPAVVSIDPKSQDIYVFSGLVHNILLVKEHAAKKKRNTKGYLTVFGPFDNPRKKSSCPLPKGYGGGTTTYLYSGMGFPLSAAVDGYTDSPTIWLTREWRRENVLTRGKISYYNINLFVLKNGKLELKRDFNKEVVKSVKRIRPAEYARPRLYANPKNGKVYVGEGETATGKAFKTLIELTPDSGNIRVIGIPFDAEDMCFDHNGFAYLRNIWLVARYDPETWREVPWDYGEERKKVCTSSSSDRKMMDVISGLRLPANGGWHHGGMFVSLLGNIAVACGYHIVKPVGNTRTGGPVDGGLAYSPKMYPGRTVAGRGGAPLIHIWDKHGKLVLEDIIPGISGNTYGIGLDPDGGVYMMASGTRVMKGKRYFNRLTGTVVKVVPGRVKILSRTSKKIAIPLPEGQRPKRAVDMVNPAQGPSWIEGEEWMYGGVGYMGKNAGIGCGCWNGRMAFDYFNRTFAPEIDRFRIAVLDSNGNLILRIGQYGNADDGKPLVSTRPSSLVPRHSLGGDEVGMVHGANLAVHTDERLYVADSASDRIFSVKLGYHTEEKVGLSNQ